MADGRLSGGAIRTFGDGISGNARLSGGATRIVFNYPAEEGKSSHNSVRAFLDGTSPMGNVSGVAVRVLIKGRVDDPKVRVWTYTLDGHDYYVIRLGNIETLVYDTHSEQWSVYGDNDSDIWRAYQGINWEGSRQLADFYGSNVIVGDDANGSLYFLDPDQYVDDSRLVADETETFERVFQGQLSKRGYDYEKCYAVELLGSIGKMDQPTLTDITLSISDDQGVSYADMGTITVPNEDYSARVNWRSLGSFTAPGRLFKITDYGAIHRIDSLTADTDRERE